MFAQSNVVHLAALPIEGDRLFFEDNPKRRYRVRLAGPQEKQDVERFDGSSPPTGFKLFTFVQNMGPGFRLRRFHTLPATLNTRIGDEEIEGILVNGFVPEDLIGGSAA